MTTTLERNPRVLSHDLYTGPTESQLDMLDRLSKLQKRYAALINANPLFTEAVHDWVEQERDDEATMSALSQFKLELDAEVEGMTDEERAINPDADLHKMVKLRLEIATLKLDIETSAQVTSLDLYRYTAA